MQKSVPSCCSYIAWEGLVFSLSLIALLLNSWWLTSLKVLLWIWYSNLVISSHCFTLSKLSGLFPQYPELQFSLFFPGRSILPSYLISSVLLSPLPPFTYSPPKNHMIFQSCHECHLPPEHDFSWKSNLFHSTEKIILLTSTSASVPQHILFPLPATWPTYSSQPFSWPTHPTQGSLKHNIPSTWGYVWELNTLITSSQLSSTNSIHF